MRKFLIAAIVLAVAGTAWAQPTCNDIHVVGVEAVDPTGTPQGIFDKLVGDVICAQFDLIEIGVGGAVVDILVEIYDSESNPVEICCLDDIGLPGVGVPFSVGPAAPPADIQFTCCYALQPDDPVGNYTITVTVFDSPGSCETACVPGSWNQAEVEVTGVVPVELSSFDADVDRNSVTVRWTTASEDENLGFYILRSTELEGDYTRISDMIDAQGTPSVGAEYSYTDDVSSGVYFYRLEDVASDGTTTLHDPARVVVSGSNSWGAIKSEFDE